MKLNIFSCACRWSVYLLWRNIYLGPLPIFDLVVCFDAVKHHELFVTLSLVGHIICKYFFANLWVIFAFIVSFVVQKFLGLSMPYLFIFGFVFIILRDGQKKILLQFMSESVLLMFFSTSFIVFGLTVVSLMHFEIIFVCRVKELSDFIFLHVAVQFSKHHLLKRLSFQHLVVLHPLS